MAKAKAGGRCGGEGVYGSFAGGAPLSWASEGASGAICSSPTPDTPESGVPKGEGGWLP